MLHTEHDCSTHLPPSEKPQGDVTIRTGGLSPDVSEMFKQDLEKFQTLSSPEKQEFIRKFVLTNIEGKMASRNLRDSEERNKIIDGIYGTVLKGGTFREDQLDNVMKQAIKLAELARTVDSGNIPEEILHLSTEELERRKNNPLFWFSSESLVYEQRTKKTYATFWADDNFKIKTGFIPIDDANEDRLITGSGVAPFQRQGLVPQAIIVGDLMRSYPGVSSIGGYRPGNIAGTNTPTDHASGKALDIMMKELSSKEGWDIANELVGNARELGIKYIIWDKQSWSVSNPSWKPYSHPGGGSNATLDHRDHVHVSFL